MIELRARLDTPEGADWLRRAAWVVLAASLLAFVVRGGGSPADPYFEASNRRPLAGFQEIAFTVTDPNGAMAEWCALLAAAEAQRAQGLMGQEDLRGYDAMVFRYDEPSDGGFWMKDTLIPLTVAYFDSEGRFISAQGMDPCPADATSCPTYPATAPFTHAIEVPRGGLSRLAIEPGSSISFPENGCR